MKMTMRVVATIAMLCWASVASAEDWKPLFDGKSLDGWVQRGGKANYRVEDGAIVGTSVPNTPNSFLCTAKDYGDFVLELEFKVDNELNSGVQFRSQYLSESREVEYMGQKIKEPKERVFGYQCEIDPSPRAYSAGIYDESRRGWLKDLKDNEAARKAFKSGEWNKLRIECQGDQDLHQRCACGRHQGRTDAQGLHRFAGAWRRQAGRTARSPLAQHPHSREVRR
jgi:hypothetical protein